MESLRLVFQTLLALCREMRDLVTEMNANDLVTLVTDQTRVRGTPDGHLSQGECYPRL